MTIRQKILLILLITAGIPLIGGLIAIGIVGKKSVFHEEGSLLKAKALSVVGTLTFSVNEHVDFLYNWSALPLVEKAGQASLAMFKADGHRFSSMDIEAVEALWTALSVDDPDLQFFLGNPLAVNLADFMKVNQSFVEILVTDAEGRLLAASNKSSDFWQADETWWQRGVLLKARQVRIEGIDYDESAGVYSLDIIVPIFSEGSTEPMGLVKGVLDITPMIISVSQFLEEPGQNTLAIHPGGKVLIHTGISQNDIQNFPVADPARISNLILEEGGWNIGEEFGRNKVFAGYHAMWFSGKTELGVQAFSEGRLLIVETNDFKSVMAPISYQINVLLFVGLIGVGILLIVADRIVHYSIVRPISILRKAAENITWMPTSTKADPDFFTRTMAEMDRSVEKIRSRDEIKDLSSCFQKMAHKIMDNEVQLLDYQRTLEVEIGARTEDLRTANKALEVERLALEKAVLELERKNEDLESFAYIVSHDLKAPLRAIGSISDWLSEDYRDKVNKEGQEMLDLMRNRVTRLDGLIDGVLEYSRAGKELPVESVDVARVVNECIEELAVPDTIEIVIRDELPRVMGHRVALRQVFQNLIENAVRYMDKEKGSIEIFANEQDDFWEFCVKDNGQGIDKKYFDRIFKLFQKLHSRDEIEGTGIGLSLVKRRVETAGGLIKLDSEPGIGSAFIFTWPKKAEVT